MRRSVGSVYLRPRQKYVDYGSEGFRLLNLFIAQEPINIYDLFLRSFLPRFQKVCQWIKRWPDLLPWEYGNRCFLVALYRLLVRRQNFQSSNQKASPSAGKNTGGSFSAVLAQRCVPTAISSDENISEVSGCHLLRQMSSQWEWQKFTSRIGVSWTHSLPFYF